jgi:hypothetical protein
LFGRLGFEHLSDAPLVSRSGADFTIMANFPGRNDRRRRVLKEELLAASGTRAPLRAVGLDHAAHQPSRYSDAAGVENHPQVTDFVPRRYRTIALVVIAGLASTMALAGLHQAAPAFAGTIGLAGLPPFDLASAGSLASWVAAVVLLAASMLCLLIYSIRRHRIDDYRGRYRIWLAASLAGVLLSANSIAGLHHVLAFTFSHATGWTALRAGAVWWLIVGGAPLGWIAFRAVRDVAECRLAVVLWLAAIGCYAAALACYLQFVPAIAPQIDPILCSVWALVGHWFLLAAIMTYARYVILDAQGLIPSRGTSTRTKQKPTATTKASAAAVGVSSAAKIAPAMLRPAAPANREAWVDGSKPEPEDYDDEDEVPGPSRKLSKADRKRLRKLKAQNQNRAA